MTLKGAASLKSAASLQLKYNYESAAAMMHRRIDIGVHRVLHRFGFIAYRYARRITKGNPKNVRPEGKAWREGSGKLRNSIRFIVEQYKDSVTLGFSKYVRSTETHEFGLVAPVSRGRRARRVKYKRRPVMQLSMDHTLDYGRKRWPDTFRKYFEGKSAGY